MSKKKIRKDDTKKEFQYSKELQGLLLILIGVIGVGNFGIIGGITKKFAIFLFGNWYIILLILSLILGIYLIAKRKSPNYFTARLVGLYTIIIALLLFSHIDYLKNNDLSRMDIFKSTIDNIMNASTNYGELRNTGGGMIGALFAVAFVSLFDIEGTNIVVIVLAMFGLIMFFDITLSDIFKVIISPIKKLIKKEQSSEVEEDNEEEETPRVVISSVDELNPIKYENLNSSEQLSIDDIERPYEYPPLDLLIPSKSKGKINSTEFITTNTKVLEQTFKNFDIIGKVVEVHPGPAVTQYEVELQAGTKVNKVLSIDREIALALAAKDVRIQAPIPGKNTIGIEIPNPIIAEVKMRDILEKIPRKYDNSKLLAPLGKDIMGNCQFMEIDKTPHLLIAGATGSGKSVCINTIITTILMRTRPDEVKLVLVDPKKVELSVYEGVPHLLTPVVTDPKKASVALQKIVHEMENRYERFNETGTKNLPTYNDYVERKNRHSETKMEKLPYILVVIDEVADLMLVAAKEVEESITRIAQLARAAGIHLIVATQRPSTDVITGLIKANIPSRLSFAVSSSIDSRTILDSMGAEKLLGRGDMLFSPMGERAPIRIQGSFITDDEIKSIVDFVRKVQKPVYDETFVNLDHNHSNGEKVNGGTDEDPLYNDILEFAIKSGKISASLIQRKYRIGYNRAARIIDIFEERGIVGTSTGSKPRNVLVKLEEK